MQTGAIGLTSNVIEIDHAARRFGEIHAVRDVSLAVQQGEIFGLIGPNGAGKSTLFRLVLGLLPLSSGEIRIKGRAVRGEAFRQVRRRVGYLPENVVLYDNLSALETLWFFAGLKDVQRTSCLPLLEKVGLGAVAHRRVGGFSKGMRQRLGFAQALLGEPTLLLLDEPTSGLDPEGIRDFYQTLHALRAEGVTVLVTSHILAEIQQRVDRLAIMREGRIHATGTVQSLRESAGLRVRYQICAKPGRLQSLQDALSRSGMPLKANGDHLTVECRQESKMAVLGALCAIATDVADIQIREPSLEDILLGHAALVDEPVRDEIRP